MFWNSMNEYSRSVQFKHISIIYLKLIDGQNVTNYDVEHSEVMLYHVRILELLGDFSEALNLLDTCAKSRTIVDRTAIREFRGLLCVITCHNGLTI